MLKVIQVSYAFPPSFAGYGRQLATVNDELLRIRDSLAIEVLTAFDGHRSQANGLTVSGLLPGPRGSYGSVLSFYAFWPSLLFTLGKRVRAADVVHVVKAGPEAVVAVLLTKLFGKPIVVKIVQDEYDPAAKAGALRRLRRRIVSQADALVAISTKIRDDLLRAGVPKDRIVEIPNSVDAARFVPVDAAQSAQLFLEATGRCRRPGETAFLFLGAICRRKGVHELLDAVEALEPGGPVVLLLAGPDYGDIPDFAERVAAINARRGDVEVAYLGASASPERLLQAVDALVLPSYSEGMPNVVLESMACGVPVIASDIPVHRELISPHTGRLFALGDVAGLTRCLAEWSKLDIEEMARSCRETVLTRYAVPIIAGRYAELYDRLANA
jgi:glycosyltransferase involved in cell wall biosynthesis